MCTVKTPKPQPVVEKDPVYMRNRYVDGLGIGAENSGRNAFRIDPGTRASRPGDRPPRMPGYNDYVRPTTGAYSTENNPAIDAARRAYAIKTGGG